MNINLAQDSTSAPDMQEEIVATGEFPQNFHYIGPIIWEPKMKTPDWLE